MKKSGYLNTLERRYNQKLQVQRLFDMQYALDAAVMACNDVFGAGSERAKKFCESYMSYMDEVSKLISEDGATDKDILYARTKIDDKLKSILGEYFAPWDIRYDFK